jgi:hypothetical protein
VETLTAEPTGLQSLAVEPQLAAQSALVGTERYTLVRSAVAIPVLADLMPAWDRRTVGFTTELGKDGLRLEVEANGPVTELAWMVGVEASDGAFHYAPLLVTGHELVSTVRTVLDATFGGPAARILNAEWLTPHLQPDTLQFRSRLEPAVLEAWAGTGVLRPVQYDRLLLCPRCLRLPTLRMGCQACGSARLAPTRMIHHFACAYVGWDQDFASSGTLVCPKCMAHSLVIGADYEYMPGPSRCIDCLWEGTELEHVAQCMGCGFRFRSSEAVTEEIQGYDAERLDLLALLAEAR